MQKEKKGAQNWVTLNPHDNIGVVTRSLGLAKGSKLILATQQEIEIRDLIPMGHKVALQAIPAGAQILKFGHVIGVATSDILAGQHVHTHNVTMPPDDLIDSGGYVRLSEKHGNWNELPSTFQGYLRKNGTAGVRNYIVVVASVNCSATVVKAICRYFLNQDFSKQGIHGVIPISHASGCAQAIGGENYSVLNRTLAGWVFHPNVVGAVIVGLGCEGTTFRSILETKKALNLSHEIPLQSFTIQDVGGTTNAIQQGIDQVTQLIKQLPAFQREELPVSKLNLALNCGGSDAFSSLTANPALGRVSDILVSKKGTVALAEIPECTGAEELLYQRATSEKTKEKLRQIFSWWNDYASRNHVTLNENLAPGNIQGGITTIVEKSLGAVAKGGTTPLTQVVDYAEPIIEHGFTLMNTPGFDPVSVTGLVAGGCNLVAFTTGRGSVYGCSIAPTIKIATHSELFKRMPGDMDIDAGDALLDGNIEGVAERLFRLMIDVANGTQTCSEKLGLGWEEFTPWPVGETL